MKHVVRLFRELDQTTSTNAKVAALTVYFSQAGEEDKLWTIALLSHRRPKRTLNTTKMKALSAELAGLPFWLLDESHHIVGDLAETIAKILPPPKVSSDYSLSHWMEEIQKMSEMDESSKMQHLATCWDMLEPEERFVLNKIITGGFRMGVSQKLMTRALSAHTGIDEHILAHRLMGDWAPGKSTFQALILAPDRSEDISKPYPFFLCYSLDGLPEALGREQEWAAEYKWDGIRAQVIVRENKLFVWSRGEELVTDKYPEFEAALHAIPNGTVLDGEILPYKNGQLLSFNDLQTRIGRKKLTPAILSSTPVIFRIYDVLEFETIDVRSQSYTQRRNLLTQMIPNDHPVLHISEEINFGSWNDLKEIRSGARKMKSEGIMLKNRSSTYATGRKKGDWWKWKVDAMTVDAVLIYAMRGHGRRANLYTDYTFAVWDNDRLVTFTKAYTGLTDKELVEVDRFVKRNTQERFGPVRSVDPILVFEIAFEGIHASPRHKSGIALRFPRIKRWRKDKPASEANTLDDLKQMLDNYHLE